MLATVVNLVLVVLCFSAIIVIHELGHFLAAKWAGIRTLAFAVGFGPALVSYRRGLGWRRGSSDAEYQKLLADDRSNRLSAVDGAGVVSRAAGVGSTEYRLNALPFGGYVKMLGQDDADPGARSGEPDSYQNCKPWKRMVVISAGVAANLITAPILFVLAFHFGMMTEVPRIGDVDPSTPAGQAVAVNGAAVGVSEEGLRAGDRVLSINGETPSHYGDIALAVMMSRPGVPLRMLVQREGATGPVEFEVTPERDEGSKLISIGAPPYASTTLPGAAGAPALPLAAFERQIAPVTPGSTLVEIAGAPVKSVYELERAMGASGGEPVPTIWRGPAGERTAVDLQPRAVLQTLVVPVTKDRDAVTPHLLGLTPVATVQGISAPESAAGRAGLKPGDVFVSVGTSEWPSFAAAMRQIATHAGEPLGVVVLRKESGAWREVQLRVDKVPSDGRLGFTLGDADELEPRIGDWPGEAGKPIPSGASLPNVRGSIIRAVNGVPVATYADVREQVVAAVTADEAKPIGLDLELPAGASERLEWTLAPGEAAAVRALGWASPIPAQLFEPERFLWRASGVGEALRMGLHEERSVVIRTYLTFARLFQGTVRVQELKGPVGIAHTGVLIAERGYPWLLFFMALVSVNLAVINFLPIPIADGGHMVFLIYEQITGRAPSVRVQNAAAIVGLLALGSLFVIVTFNDVTNVWTALRTWWRS